MEEAELEVVEAIMGVEAITGVAATTDAGEARFKSTSNLQKLSE